MIFSTSHRYCWKVFCRNNIFSSTLSLKLYRPVQYLITGKFCAQRILWGCGPPESWRCKMTSAYGNKCKDDYFPMYLESHFVLVTSFLLTEAQTVTFFYCCLPRHWHLFFTSPTIVHPYQATSWIVLSCHTTVVCERPTYQWKFFLSDFFLSFIYHYVLLMSFFGSLL